VWGQAALRAAPPLFWEECIRAISCPHRQFPSSGVGNQHLGQRANRRLSIQKQVAATPTPHPTPPPRAFMLDPVRYSGMKVFWKKGVPEYLHSRIPLFQKNGGPGFIRNSLHSGSCILEQLLRFILEGRYSGIKAFWNEGILGFIPKQSPEIQQRR